MWFCQDPTRVGLCHGGNVLGNHHHHCLRYAYLTTWWDMMMWTICDWSDNGAIFRVLINLIEVNPTLTVRVWNRGHHEIICELSSHLWSLDDSARTFDDSVMSVKKGTVWNYSWDIFWSAVWWTMVPEAWQEKPQNRQRCTVFHYSFKPWSAIQRAIVGGAMLH